LIRDVWFTGGDEDDGFGYDYGTGKWYSFCLERYFGLITWVNAKTWLSTSNNNLTNYTQLLDLTPHKASPLQPNGTFY
jgi:hypothetical protein